MKGWRSKVLEMTEVDESSFSQQATVVNALHTKQLLTHELIFSCPTPQRLFRRRGL